MDYFEKKCKKCGKSFMGTRTQQYCCTKCRKPPESNSKTDGLEKPSAKKAKPKKKRYVPTVDEMASRARELGMSYGKYVEMLAINEAREEREMRILKNKRKEEK